VQAGVILRCHPSGVLNQCKQRKNVKGPYTPQDLKAGVVTQDNIEQIMVML